MIRRDIAPQWSNIAKWYWQQYQEDQPNLTIWDILERDHGAQRTCSMVQLDWSVLLFPDEQSYTLFLLKWS